LSGISAEVLAIKKTAEGLIDKVGKIESGDENVGKALMSLERIGKACNRFATTFDVKTKTKSKKQARLDKLNEQMERVKKELAALDK